ncbi:MAG: diguanylate cyclase [Proteobacteria bacterium]|nr:diguanylate cyclase [Pseudomonadota bacterium]MBU1711322.1 diguanylate cyclase [Pseudomonadota bacterium]
MEQTEKQNILIVDDRPVNLMVLKGILEEENVHIIEATSGNEALGLVFEHDFSLILLDVQMPDMDGFETAELMRGIERSRNVPIIFVTAISKEQKYIFKGYEIGAVDYMFKPLDSHVLKSKVKVFLELDRHKKEVEKTTQALLQTVKELEKSKKIIEEQNKALHELAIRDGLTGLYNHRHFRELLAHEISSAQRYKHGLHLLLLDLDFFKKVNDTFGHSFGDFVLREFVGVTLKVIRETDIMGRYGGEEFELVLPNTDLQGAVNVAEKIRKSVEEHVFKEGNATWRMTVCIGIATCTPGGEMDPEELLILADQAMYEAKAQGRNKVVVHHVPD